MRDYSIIKDEKHFIDYLSNHFQGRVSGAPLTPKVISDSLGRIRRVQNILGVKIEKSTASEKIFAELIILIKEGDSKLRELPTSNKYGYGRYVYAARLYFRFQNWKNKK